MSIQNKLLQSAIDGVEAQLTPENRANYDKIVTAGLQAALHRGIDGMMAGIKKYPDPVQAAAVGSVNLVLLLAAHTQGGPMPKEALVPASYTLMCQALAFIEEAKMATIDEATLVKATKLWTNTIFSRFKITPQKLQALADGVQDVVNNPGKVEMLNRHTGYAKDPRASTPMQDNTPAPAAPPMNRRQRRRAARAAGRR